MATLIPKYTQVTSANRTIAEKLAEHISVKDYGAVGNGTTDDTSAINAALSSGAKSIYFPAGTYKITSSISIIATTGINIYGDGYNSILDFSTLASGHAITYGDGTTGASHCSIKDLLIKGGGGASGLRLYGGNTAGTTLCRFENLTISSFATNLTTNNAWINQFDNVHCSQSTGINAVIGAASNNILFNRCGFVGGTQAVTITNTEGVQFNSCEFANQTSATYQAIALSQSQATLINPYFENIASSKIASVGIPAESLVKSALIIEGGQVNITSPIIVANTDKCLVKITGTNCQTNDITFLDSGSASSAIYSLVSPSEITTNSNPNIVSQYNATNEVFYGNKNIPPYGVGGGVTFTTYRNYIGMQTSIAGRGINIGSGLTIGNKYTIVLAIRGTAGNAFLSGVGGNVTIPGYPDTSGNWIVQYIPVTASAAIIGLALANTADTLQIKLAAVLNGHKFPSYDIYRTPLNISSTAAPTVDTWIVGDIVMNSAPAVGQPKGWMCTVAGTPGTWASMGNL